MYTGSASNAAVIQFDLERIGYNVNLCEAVKDGLSCPFCELVMRTPIQTYRGEVACRYCYKQAKRGKGTCPIDSEPIEGNEFFTDKYKAREILALKCYCGNMKYGCEWQGVIGEVEQHQVICTHKLAPCPLCSEEIKLIDVNSHAKLCRKLPTDGECVFPDCSYRGEDVDDLKLHLERDVIDHTLPQALALKKMQMQFELRERRSKEKEEQLEGKVNELEKQCTFLMQNMKDLHTVYNTTITQLQQSVDGLKKKLLQPSEHSNNSIEAVNSRSAASMLPGDVAASIKIFNQNLSDLNLRQQLHENTTFDGKLLWKIDDVSKRLHQAIIGKVAALHSAPTFTERYGYKFCGRLYLNGDGIGRCTHVSMFFVLMKTEYDNLLTWSFNRRITMRLINQADSNEDVIERFDSDVNSSSFLRPEKDMNVASGCPLFVTSERFLHGGFIKDDCVFIELSVSNANEECE